MGLLPYLIQVICITLDLYLLFRLPNGMPRNYIAFALARSIIRMYAQLYLSLGQWNMIYWWGELVGYIVVVVLIVGATEKLLNRHTNTALFYASMALIVTVIAVWHLPHPLTLESLWTAGSTARMAAMFLLLMAMVLGYNWDPMTRWVSSGIVLNLIAQWIGSYFLLKHDSILEITLVQQLGFLNLQLCWLVGVWRQHRA